MVDFLKALLALSLLLGYARPAELMSNNAAAALALPVALGVWPTASGWTRSSS